MFLRAIAAFIVGLLLGAYLLFFPITITLFLVVIAFGLTWHEHRGPLTASQGVFLYAVLMGGILYWVGAGWIQASSDLLLKAGNQVVTITGEVIDPVKSSPHRIIVMVNASHMRRNQLISPVSGHLRLTWHEPAQNVFRGDIIEVTARIRAPHGTLNPGGFNYADYLKRKGVHAVVFVSGPGGVQIIHPAPETSVILPWLWIDQWRNQIRQAAIHTLHGAALGLFLGMVIGEQSYIDSAARDEFMATGTIHIISISGSHLGLLAFLSFVSVRWGCRHMPVSWFEWMTRRISPSRLAALVTVPLVVFYTGLAGAEIPTVRSLIMILIFLLALWLGRERHLMLTLGLSALVVLLFEPAALFDTSFQLSYVAVFALALVLKGRMQNQSELESFTEHPKRWMANWLRLYGRMTLAVTMATLPLVAYYFNQIAWLGLFANALIVPLVGFIIVPLGLFSALSVLILDLPKLPLGWVNQFALDTLTTVNSFLAQFPFAEWHVSSPGSLTMVLFYGFFWMLIGGRGNSLAVRWVSIIGLVFIVAGWLWSPRWDWEPGTLRVTFLDVSQGDAAVLELPNGQSVLIDGGAAFEHWDFGRGVVGPFLWDRGIRHLDHVIATHPQIDHIGGLRWVIKNFSVGTFWHNGLGREKLFYENLRQAVQQSKVREEVAVEGTSIMKDDSCHFWSLNPPRHIQKPFLHGEPVLGGSELNNLSVVTRLDCQNHSFLFTADAESETLNRLMDVVQSHPVRVVKIPHHGARSSFNLQWIQGIHGELAVVSSGKYNRYGHPVPAVLDAYRKNGMAVYRTDRDGAVWIKGKLDSLELIVETASAQELVPVMFQKNMGEREMQNWRRVWFKWQGRV